MVVFVKKNNGGVPMSPKDKILYPNGLLPLLSPEKLEEIRLRAFLTKMMDILNVVATCVDDEMKAQEEGFPFINRVH